MLLSVGLTQRHADVRRGHTRRYHQPASSPEPVQPTWPENQHRQTNTLLIPTQSPSTRIRVCTVRTAGLSILSSLCRLALQTVSPSNGYLRLVTLATKMHHQPTARVTPTVPPMLFLPVVVFPGEIPNSGGDVPSSLSPNVRWSARAASSVVFAR